MKHVVDHLGRNVTYAFPPKRIVSLCPAITETLFHLGLQQEIVGRTKYCIFPEQQVADVQTVGGTKQVDLTTIQSLQPDLIIMEKEENTKEMVDMLEKHFPVYVFQVESISEAQRMVEDAGQLVNRVEESKELVRQIDAAFKTLPQKAGRAAYMMWRKPYMVVGATTYINDMLETVGFENPFTAYEGRYPVVDIEALKNAQLDYLFLSTEPFPFAQKHIEELAVHLPNTTIQIIDGEMFWYGAKMKEAAPYLKQFWQ
ncbi:helical backbone metal receptor [Lysinibacillus sp. KU-BSD001]|uniref:ABC transporter substrate-binding protein n=1 Tax=Lysinibacillus sp. KU-BSD001 TaxID=3141328 RepID=UPI0036E6F2A4